MQIHCVATKSSFTFKTSTVLVNNINSEQLRDITLICLTNLIFGVHGLKTTYSYAVELVILF